MVDYTNEGFTIPIERDGARGYASIHSLLYSEDDGLDITGNYFVYVLHPTKGSFHFDLERSGDENNPWQVSEDNIWLDDITLKEITDAIEIKRMKEELNLNS